MSYRIKDYLTALDKIAPFALTEKWDNTGLLVGCEQAPVTRALVALDATNQVVDEAAELGAQLIITHHPVIFSPLKSLEAGSIAYRLAQEGIGVISAHTNLDIARGGVNSCLADCLGLTRQRPLVTTASRPYYKILAGVPNDQADRVYHAMAEAGAGAMDNYSHCAFLVKGEGRFRPLNGSSPVIGSVGQLEMVEETLIETLVSPGDLPAVVEAMKKAHPYEVPAYDLYENHAVLWEEGLGVSGTLEEPLAPEDFAALVKERLGLAAVAYSPGNRPVKRVALCGGSAGEYLEHALGAGADAYLTAEVKHHTWLEAKQRGITLVDGGHYHTEAVVLEPLRARLETLLPGAAIQVACRQENPYQIG